MVSNRRTDRTSQMCSCDIITYSMFWKIMMPNWHSTSLSATIRTASSELLESRKWSCVIFPACLSPWTITGWGGGVLLICLDNMKGAGASISIKTVIVLNYLYDCPLELLSMLFSLSTFSKSLSSARWLCEANTMQPVDSPQKGIALESHTSAGWPLAVGSSVESLWAPSQIQSGEQNRF